MNTRHDVPLCRYSVWFKPYELPARLGWYARKHRRDPESIQFMNYWDGEHWHYNESQSPNAPATKPGTVCFYNECWLWRGLNEEATNV